MFIRTFKWKRYVFSKEHRKKNVFPLPAPPSKSPYAEQGLEVIILDIRTTNVLGVNMVQNSLTPLFHLILMIHIDQIISPQIKWYKAVTAWVTFQEWSIKIYKDSLTFLGKQNSSHDKQDRLRMTSYVKLKCPSFVADHY